MSSIPKGWQESTVGDACQIQNGLRFPISVEDREKIAGEYPYYGPTGVLSYINEYRADGKYALIGEDGDHFLKYGNRAMTLLVEGKFNVNNHAHVIKGTSTCLTEWFFYYFMHKPLTPYLTRQGAGRYKLNKAALEKLPLLLPPLEEQRKIADILSTWDEAIEEQTRLLELKHERKRGLMQQLLTGKVRFKEFEGLGWESRRLGELFAERNEAGFNDLPLLSITRERGVIYRNEVERKDTSNVDKSKYLRICPGDIGYNTMRMWQGVSALSSLEGIISPAYTVCIPGKEVHAPYFSYLFKYQPMTFTFKRFSQGLTSDTWNLKFNNCSEIVVNVPSFEEQQKIATVLSTADAELEILETQLTTLRTQKRGLMQQLLTGRTRVNLA